jgi:hypothetical protein
MEVAMDWNAAIKRHRNALKRVLATLAALAGVDASALPIVLVLVPLDYA